MDRLIIFTRYPRVGETKTRLIPALGAERAAELQRRMTEHTLCQARAFGGESGAQVEVRYTSGVRREMQQWLGRGVWLRTQGAGDLGVRLARSFRAAFDEGCLRVVTIGTDCPGIRPGILSQAFTALGNGEIVLGPARDGGYYLVGLSRMRQGLFDAIPWGTAEVAAVTRNRAAQQGVDVVELAELADVDVPEDLNVWEALGAEG